MSDFANKDTKNGFTCKLWRGERMTMIGFDVAQPEPDLVGFSIEVKYPGAHNFAPLKNRIAFSYPQGAANEVNGDRNFSSLAAPFQKFRWVHFPSQPTDGTYAYRVTKQHMPQDDHLVAGTSLTVDIEHRPVTYDGLVDVGFSRNFASSQAYREQFGNNPDIIPKEAKKGLEFEKSTLENDRHQSVYVWLGFEAYDLLFGFLERAKADAGLTLDVMAYDLNERDIVGSIESFGPRLRAIVDDSSAKENGVPVGHDLPSSAESKSAKRFKQAGARVKRTHFHNLQHNKVFITRRNGVPESVLCGSTNFTYRGLYIQANNMLVFHSAAVAAKFGEMFDLAFANPSKFRDEPFAKTWHAVTTEGKPTIYLCFSPHRQTDLSLNPIRAAIDQATSSVFYSVAFLSQMTKGPTIEAFRRLINRPIFSCGTADKRGKLELRKPDGTIGLVDFDYLAKKAPEPFKSEWSGGKGRNIHHKFVVTDFSLPTAKVFTGSSNFSPSGEEGNGDHLIMIEDRKVATAYAIEAVRVFDHLQFRNRMRRAFGPEDTHLTSATAPEQITLGKPTAISHKPAWFEKSYKVNSQAFRDRELFST
jgi:phosphatidylserine/phosphatidylglycerophosphate/cardiolipin synthase-like enzyme